MANKKIIYFVLAIMCFALTVGICVQIKTVKYSNTVVTQNYEQNNLKVEVLKYKEKYESLIKQTEEIDNQLQMELDKATENNSELEDAKNRITKGNKLIGLAEVTGAGVIIEVGDSKIETGSAIGSSDLLVHDKDILKIINELKNAGAEAISINNQRVILTTSIICGGNIININGEKIGSPFEIKAIGLPDTLANLLRPGGYLNNLQENRKLEVSLKKSNNITIPKYSGVLNFKYLKNVNQ